MTVSDILIFHFPSSRSGRIVWLCEELDLKYDLEVIKHIKEIKTDEYKQKNPNGLLPAVKIEGEFYYESGAIMQIILERFAHGKLTPAANTKQRGKFLKWMWFLEATFTPHLSQLNHHKNLLPDDKKVPEVQFPCWHASLATLLKCAVSVQAFVSKRLCTMPVHTRPVWCLHCSD
ncbi:hypothetical protein ABBQ38_005455 [Trebouxia sp. C0009 RCD-2024]